MEPFKTYEIMVLLTNEFTNTELKNWAFEYIKTLRTFKAGDISVISRGKRPLSYLVFRNSEGHFLQFKFTTIPKYVKTYFESLEKDDKVLRAILFLVK